MGYQPHPNREACVDAILQGDDAALQRLIAQDPRVLVSYGRMDSGSRQRVDRPLLVTALRQEKHPQLFRTIAAALTAPENQPLLCDEMRRQGREFQPENPLCLPFQPVLGDSGYMLPHYSMRSPVQMKMLLDAGYDPHVSLPGAQSLAEYAVQQVTDEYLRGPGDRLIQEYRDDELETFAILRKKGVDLNALRLIGNGYGERLPVHAYLMQKFWERNQRQDSIFAVYTDMLEALCKQGVDIRPVFESTCPAYFSPSARDFGLMQLDSCKAHMQSHGKSWMHVCLDGDPQYVPECTAPLCATGLLPELLHTLIDRRDAGRLEQVLENVDAYWRGEYAHAVRASEAALHRIAPLSPEAKDSALAERAGGR